MEEKLAVLIPELVERIRKVYNLDMADAEKALRQSAFFQKLTDEAAELWKDDGDKNFGRYQNEVEYGAWNRNEHGGIAD